VTQHNRALALPLAIADVKVRMADSCRRHPDADLSRSRRIELERLDPDRDARPVEDGGTDRGGRGHGRRIARRGEPVAA
jgi:hypothetical protein